MVINPIICDGLVFVFCHPLDVQAQTQPEDGYKVTENAANYLVEYFELVGKV
eukprot:CAMPEP_0203746842 /NCGR_PEP_ID=MMETSP0098-20131031/2167_1 /ASSEMBLY_ACC=CAM_ASM_000208 /TAXON_ID=96639 /ORGANISM=" , Strain NY0313808BC1" /LENGTH=51 /DNA_ID=CAMNT_0050635089 /DNA_START=377 /DNA_END=532 /DNA_ORIENTATION=-